MSEEEFDDLVANELDNLPDHVLEGVDNLVFMVEDRPEDGSDTLGVYEGFSVVDRSMYGYGEMPDRIVLYRENLLKMCESREHLAEEVHITLVHELAHYFGIDEKRLHELGWG